MNRIEYDYGIAKHIRIDTPDGKRMWWEPKGVRMADLPLWNSDLLRESRFDNEPVLVVEGEKDANRGVMFGFCCVSFPGGASQRDFGEAPLALAGRDIVLVPDKDKPGLALMERVASALADVGVKSLKLLRLPPSDHDLSNFLNEAADDDPVGARVALRDCIDTALVLWP
jgi:hypothetical protein